MAMGVAVVERKRVERKERRVSLWGSMVRDCGVLLKSLLLFCRICNSVVATRRAAFEVQMICWKQYRDSSFPPYIFAKAGEDTSSKRRS